MNLLDALRSRNEWWGTGKVPEALLKETRRAEFENLVGLLQDERIVSIIGPRRCGKTTLMYQLIDRLLRDTDSKNILFYSMDDPSLAPYRQDLPENIFKTYYAEVLGKGIRDEKVFCFIDEVHFYKDWELWLKRYQDMSYPVKFIISSSSSAHLSNSSRESLVGRILEVLVLPLSFPGYLNLLGEKDALKHYEELTLQSADPSRRFHLEKYAEKMSILYSRYLLRGGFPETLKVEDIRLWQERLISDVLRKAIYRDIVELHEIRTPSKLEDLFVHLAYNTSQAFSYNSLSNNLGIGVEAAINYTSYLKEAHLIGELKLHTTSSEKRLRANRRYFLTDTGLLNAVTGTRELTGTNMGLLVESSIQQGLNVYAKKNNAEIYYWREKQEVDVILKKGKTLMPIEVKYTDNIKSADLKRITKYMQENGIKTGYVATKNLLEERTIPGGQIILMPAWMMQMALR